MIRPASESPSRRKRSAATRTDASESRITPAFVLQALRQWWKWILPIGLALAVTGSVLALWTFEPKYEAVAWVRIDERPTYVAFQTGAEERWTSFVNTQVELLRSPLVLLPVVRQPEVAAVPEIKLQADPALWLGKKLNMKSVGDSELFKVSITTSRADTSARLVNAVLDSYFTLRNNDENSRGERVIKLLEDERQRRADEVAQLRANVQNLADQTGSRVASANPATPDPAQASLLDLQSRLINAEVETEMLKARLKAAEVPAAASHNATPPNTPPDTARDAAVDQDPEVRRIAEALVAKQRKLSEIRLRSVQGERDPSYRQLHDEVARDEDSLARARDEARRRLPAAVSPVTGRRPGEDLAALRAELEGRQQATRFLRERYEAQLREVKRSDRDPLTLASRRGSLEQAERTLEMITERLTKLKTEQHAPGRISLMQRAEPPAMPIEAQPIKGLALAWLAGLFAPCSLAVVWERLVRRVTAAEMLEEQTQTPVLVEIPRLPCTPSPVRRQSSGCSGLELELFEESIDTLRASLFLSEEYQDLRWLAVTSAISGEGKSSVAAQLAVCLARATSSATLLIDGDMRAPDAHTLFGTRIEPGLAEVLGGSCPLDEAIVTTINESVHVLPAGRLVTNPHRLLGKGTMATLLAQLAGRYRHVIIDTPPVLAAGEALAMARAAEACLLCTMRDHSRISQVLKARERLEGVGARLAGLVLSGVSGRQYAYRYGDYYTQQR